MEAFAARQPDPVHKARRQAMAQHHHNLLPRISARARTVTEATHKSTMNLLAPKLHPKMALEDTLWVYHGKSRTARLAHLRSIMPHHIQGAVGPFTIIRGTAPHNGPEYPLHPRLRATMRGRPAAAPVHAKLCTIPQDPHAYLLPATDHHHAIRLHLVEHLAVGASPFLRSPPDAPSNRRQMRRHMPRMDQNAPPHLSP